MIRTWPEHDPKYRIIKSPDATNKECWPKAPSKYVFIFEAINIAGSALFADDWTGKELAVVHWVESPKAERARARLPLGKGGGARGSHSFKNASIPLPRHKDFHEQDWRAEQRQPIWEENGRALERLEQSVEWLAQRCRDSVLTAHARLKDVGGNLYPMRAGEWNVESPLFHFVINGGRKRLFSQLKYSGPFESYLFFDKAELLDVLKREPDAQLLVGEADLSRLSPYLQMAVRMALRHGYTSREACDSTPVREAEVRSAWSELLPDVPFSGKALQAIAKVIGFPDSKAIAAGKLAATPKAGGTAKA